MNDDVNMDVAIYANKKFKGYDPKCMSYCLLDNNTLADKIIAMEKLNGEAAHFSGRYIDDKFYIITGSKNVHLLICGEEDIEKYQGIR